MKVVFALVLISLLYACTDPITVGSELLDSDRASVGERTDLPFTTRVVREDSLLSYNGTSVQFNDERAVPTPGAFTFGQIEEPTFGTTRHSVYLTPRLPRNASGLPIVPQFASLLNVTIDSVVVILPIDTVRAFYGSGRTFPYQAFEISEPIGFLSDYYTDDSFPTEGTNLGYDGSFTATKEATLVRDTSITSPAVERAHVRVRLSDDFAARIDALPAESYTTDSTFRDDFAGIYLTPDGPSQALVTLAAAEPANQTPYSGFNFYFQDSTGQPAFYRMGFLLALPNNDYDYSGSLVEPLLEPGPDNEMVAVAGQGGVMTEINLEDIGSLENRVINRAVLEIPVANVEGVSYSDYPLPTRLELFYRASQDGPLLFIEDRVELVRTRASNANVNFFLGGGLETEDNVRLYSPAFSIHMQRIIDGEVPPRLYLRVTPLETNEIRAARALLNGPAAGVNPARIRVTFTDLD
ncbi:DUF4270 family protein [Neolewinella litorea]|uniref:DUF4270 family protein n=1 Tax=Neolewinella litorea TaxID=2562452 RepID=A0A4S4P050_9BACT|nr:DUF4270 family protein [Neolewinella litorea]THH41940.1 DUF4270 family protein [Neolewinella litorea]